MPWRRSPASLAESAPVGIGAALAAVFVLAQARFVAARRPPSAAVPPPASAPSAAAPSGALQPVAVPDSAPQVSRVLSGMAFLADFLTAADRIGELRQRRRLRKLERQQAERQSSGRPAPEVRRPQIIRVRPTRGFPKLPPPK